MAAYLIDTKRSQILAVGSDNSEDLRAMCAKLNAADPGRYELAVAVSAKRADHETN